MKPDEIVAPIVQGNVFLKVKNREGKAAERVVLELRDKLSKQVNETNITALVNNTLEQDALNALLALVLREKQARTGSKRCPLISPPVKNRRYHQR